MHANESRLYFGTSEHFAAQKPSATLAGNMYVEMCIPTQPNDYFGSYKRRKGKCISIAAKSIYVQMSTLCHMQSSGTKDVR